MVHVHDPRVRWSLSAKRVLRIVPAAEWHGEPAHDVLAAIGAAPADDDAAHRVMIVLATGDREIALLAAGPIKIVDIEPGSVLPLPAELAEIAPDISAIIVAHDASLSLLLDPLSIHVRSARHRDPDAAVVRNHA
jgi:chemotaxis signal transduction protein